MVFIGTEERVFTRSRAKGYKKLILDEGVTSVTPVDFLFKEDGIHAVKLDKEEDMDAPDTEYTFIVDKFGVYGDVTSDVEVLLCDEYMVVTLHSGAIMVKLNGEFMLATKNIGDKILPDVSPDKIYWVKPSTVRGFSEAWLDELKPMVDDFLVHFSIRHSGDTSRNGTYTNGINVVPAPEGQRFYDCSNGASATFLEKLVIERHREEEKSFLNAAKYAPHVSEDDFVYNEDDYMDSDEEDYLDIENDDFYI